VLRRAIMDNNDNKIIDLETKAKQMKNLRPYRNKTEEEIKQIILSREEKIPTSGTKTSNKKSDDYDKRFNEKIKSLMDEFGVDMNDANDRESLQTLARLQIQSENAARDIDNIQRKPSLRDEDYRSLKNLGDFQSTVQRAIVDFQDKLGISRKQRKEKQVDDFPQFMESLLKRGKQMFEEKTVIVRCPKDFVELARVWYNFPQKKNETQMSLECPQCGEQIEYAR